MLLLYAVVLAAPGAMGRSRLSPEFVLISRQRVRCLLGGLALASF